LRNSRVNNNAYFVTAPKNKEPAATTAAGKKQSMKGRSKEQGLSVCTLSAKRRLKETAGQDWLFL
jgi:hypothetical protein